MALSACLVFLIILGTGLLSLLSLHSYYRWAQRWQLFASADSDRHLHTGKVPTSAGLAFLWPVPVSLYVCYLSIGSSSPSGSGLWLWGQGLGLMTLLVLGHLDDRRGLSSHIRLLVQAGAVCGLLLLVMPVLQAAGYGLPWFLLFAIGGVWWLNLFNFMDGANGMASWHAVVSGAVYALTWWSAEGLACPLVLAVLLVISAGVFLFWNFPDARLFMGDAGSLGLAWLIFGLALWGVSRNVFDPAFVLALHGPFVVDTSLTLWRRWRQGEALATAHKQHVYQQLITAGTRHSVVSLGYALVSAFGGLLALMLRDFAPFWRWFVAVLWMATLLVGWFFLRQLAQNRISVRQSTD